MSVPENVFLDGKRLVEGDANVPNSPKDIPEFKLLEKEIQRHIKDFTIDSLMLEFAYQADALSSSIEDENKEDFALVEVYDYRNKENTVALNFLQFDISGNIRVKVTAKIDTQEEFNNYKGYEVIENEVFETFSIKGELLRFDGAEALPDNPDYEPGGTLTTQSWITGKFCLEHEKAKKMYKHCGPGCGDGMSKGGGTPINGLDTCCRAHDRCWKNFKSGDKCCDKTLAQCIDAFQGEDYATWLQINTYFQPRGWLCKK